MNQQHITVCQNIVSSMPIKGLAYLALLLACACTEKSDVMIIGIVRDPSQGCAEREIEYHFKVDINTLVPASIPPDWCAVMKGNPEVVCFLVEKNMKETPYLNRPRTLPHAEVEPSHPDLSCWTEVLVEWDDDYGSAPGGASEDDSYHPVWNNGG